MNPQLTRYHAIRAKHQLDHDLCREAFIARGWIAESTRELTAPAVDALSRALNQGGIELLPPCPNTPVAQEIAAMQRPPRPPRPPKRKSPADMTPVGRLRQRYRELYRERLGCDPPYNYGQDDRLLKRLIEQWGEEAVGVGLDRLTSTSLAQDWVCTSDRSMRVLYTAWGELMPEAAAAAQEESNARLHDRLRALKRPSAHAPRPGAVADPGALPRGAGVDAGSPSTRARPVRDRRPDLRAV